MLRKRGHNNSPDSEVSRRSWSSVSSASSTATGSSAVSATSKRSATEASMARPIEHQPVTKATIPAGKRRPSTQTQVLSFQQLMVNKPEICEAMEVVQEVRPDTDAQMESLVAHFAQLTLHDKHPTR